MKLSKQFRFEASHRLPFHKGKCARLHGHSWVLEVEVEGPLDPHSGFVLDYALIKSAVQPLVDELDHRHLGTWKDITYHLAEELQSREEWGVSWLPIDFNATSENLLWVLARHLPSSFPWSQLTLHETCTCAASLSRKEFEHGFQEKDRQEEAHEKRKEGDVTPQPI